MFRIIFFISTIICLEVSAIGNLKTLSGILVDDNTGKPISYATVMINSTGEGVMTNELGRFKLRVLPEDNLTIQVINYQKAEIAVPDSLLNQGKLFIVKLKPESYELNEFNVEGEKETPMALRSDVFKEKPHFTRFFVSPVSYIYYFTSRRERRKRQLLRIMENEELMASFEHIYNRDTIGKYAMLEGHDLDMCLIYCNAHIELARGDSDDEVKRKILVTLSDYFSNSFEIKNKN